MDKLEIKQKILSDIEVDLELNGFKLSETHFEIGDLMHCEDYYFAKKFFQSSDHCESMSILFADKLKDVAFSEPVTLVGYGNYMGLMLKKTIDKLENFNYATLESFNNRFSFQFTPRLNTNLVVVLPITCTSAVYIRIRKFLTQFTNSEYPTRAFQISRNFYNIFLVLDESLKNQTETIILDEKNRKKEDRLTSLYSPFNWVEIGLDQIGIRPNFLSLSLFRLYSPLHLSSNCPICFPNDEKINDERPIIPTIDKYQTPNLIFGFPNFGISHDKDERFFKLFGDINNHGDHSYLSGHVEVDDQSYDNYIRGNIFYEKNYEDILSYFDGKLNGLLKSEDKNIIFITSDNRRKSTFIEDLSSYPCLQNRFVTIFRFQPFHEFVDNFISLNGDTIRKEGTKVIYFQEVLSSGKKFKLISDYLKHINDKGNDIGLPGFFLLLTFINRLSEYTRKEIIRKLNIKDVPLPQNRLISYYHLNVPILSTSHIANPLREELTRLHGMLDDSNLDTLRLRIGTRIEERLPQQLHQPGFKRVNVENLKPYIQFFSNNILDNQVFYKAYSLGFTHEKANLLNIYLVHLLNNELSNKDYNEKNFLSQYKEHPEQFISDLFDIIYQQIEPEMYHFFTDSEKSSIYFTDRNIQSERDFIELSLVKLLSKPPFVYYKSIYEASFKFCLIRLSEINERMDGGYRNSYQLFRKFKFYIRRSIELNSNFIINHAFLANLKKQLKPESIDKIMSGYERKYIELQTYLDNRSITNEFFDIQMQVLNYQKEEVVNYTYFLLFCLKEFIYKNPSRGIYLETLLNSENLRPSAGKNVRQMIQHPYYHFVTMVKIENSYFLKELKELHKRNVSHGEIDTKANYISYYLKQSKNDPVIVSAQKLLNQSVFRSNPDYLHEIRQSLQSMLKAVDTLEGIKAGHKKHGVTNLNEQIRDVVKIIVEILGSGSSEGLEYAFCIEYRKKQTEFENTENIYTILSNETDEKPKLVQLSENGLIYQMLYGIHVNAEQKSEQTILAIINDNNEIFSFQPTFYNQSLRKQTKPLDLAKMFGNDFYNEKSGKGIEFLRDSKMTLVLRLAHITCTTEKTRSIEGQAVLVIGNFNHPSVINFQRFMDPEKLRMLLVIKDEVIGFLQKQFDNDAFIEVLEHRKRDIYQKKLEHGLSRYSIIQKSLFEESLKSNDKKIQQKNKELYDIIDTITNAQLNFKKLRIDAEPYKFSTETVLERIQDIFSSECFCGCSIEKGEIEYKGFKVSSISFPLSVYDIIIPELIINMKNYSSRQVKNGLIIKYDTTENTLIFKNDIRPRYVEQSSEKEFGGLRMCRLIVDRLKLKSMNVQHASAEFTVSINLNQS